MIRLMWMQSIKGWVKLLNSNVRNAINCTSDLKSSLTAHSQLMGANTLLKGQKCDEHLDKISSMKTKLSNVIDTLYEIDTLIDKSDAAKEEDRRREREAMRKAMEAANLLPPF